MGCWMHELPYGEFSERMHTLISGKRVPIQGTLELTARCNLRCVHCYLPVAQRACSQEGELSLVELERIFDEIAEAGCLWLLLTGGEPLLRRDFFQVYEAARRRGFILTLFTNGTLIDARAADFLAEWRPFKVEITLYGATQATYERVTGVPGSYARCMRGIELLLQRGLPLSLKSMLLTLNRHELQEMQALCNHLGLEFQFDPVVNAGIDGDLRPVQYRLSPSEIVAIEQQDPQRAAEWPKRYTELSEMDTSTRQMYVCGAGQHGFHIDAQGRLSLCLSARQPFYDLRAGSFKTGWEEFFPRVRARQYDPDFACLGCELRAQCAQCPAQGLSEMGDPEARVPFLCQLAHERQAAFAPRAAERDALKV